MKPRFWTLAYRDPATGRRESNDYTQRGAVNGAEIIARALGMADIKKIPRFEGQPRNPPKD